MSQKLAPARVPTPGKILSRELEARGWTQKDLAEIMVAFTEQVESIVRIPQLLADLGVHFVIVPHLKKPILMAQPIT